MPEEKILTILWRLGDVCRDHVKDLGRKLGLTRAEFTGLINLDEGQSITCRIFSERMGLSVSRGSRVIECLCGKGLITRVEGEADRRCKQIRLTERGEAARRRMRLELRSCEERIDAKISLEKKLVLKSELEKLIRALRES